jgi:hypothetical protein
MIQQSHPRYWKARKEDSALTSNHKGRGLRVCTGALTFSQDKEYNYPFLNGSDNPFNLEKFCSEIYTLSDYIYNCRLEEYGRGKGNDSFSSHLSSINWSDSDLSIIMSSSSHMSIYFITKFTDFKFIKEYYNSYDLSQLNEEEKKIFIPAKNTLDTILDNPKFITALYKFLWTCIYVYSIRNMHTDEFTKWVVETINSKTRDNYIISTCRPQLVNEDGNVIGPYQPFPQYRCGRALGYIDEPNKNTRFVIYNTLGADEDFMDEDWFNEIKPTLSGGRKKKTRRLRKKSRKSRKNKYRK